MRFFDVVAPALRVQARRSFRAASPPLRSVGFQRTSTSVVSDRTIVEVTFDETPPHCGLVVGAANASHAGVADANGMAR